MSGMVSIESVTLEVADTAAADTFYTATFGLGTTVQVRASDAPATGNSGPATRQIDQVVLLLGGADVAASKQFYTDRGLAVAKSFGRKYVEFDLASSPVKLALYGHRALAKDAGVPPDGTGSHRLVIGSDAGTFTDLDGFAWEAALP
jgi:catechol 2,3-dioxygenase-like lactoylglutathione lyase family enzyme